MANANLWWLLLIPLILSAASIIVIPKLDPSIDRKHAAIFSIIGLLISALIMSVAFYMGKGSKTADTELWNGEITRKDREHGSYVESYECRCRTVTSGTGQNKTSRRECDTCYRDHYTVTWTAKSNVGSFQIEHLDRTSQSVYLTPDPAEYTRIQIGEACAVKQSYTNYIKAVPESLFRPAAEEVKAKFVNMIPNYPDAIYNRWKVDRVLSVGVPVPDLKDWNLQLSNALKKLGPAKQSNVIIVLTKSTDPTYAYALQDAWVGAKKNDIVVVIGASNFPQKADWVSVMAMTNNELFKIRLRDNILALPELTASSVISAITTDTMQLHQRKSMKEFEYLDAEIDPPAWVNYTTGILVTISYVGFWIFLAWQQKQPRYGRRRRRSF